jgi:hypothetical protein
MAVVMGAPRKQQSAAATAATAVLATAVAGSGAGAPAAPISRSSAPSGLSPVALPFQSVQRKQQQLGASNGEGYTQASAYAGEAQREEAAAQASASCPPQPRSCGAGSLVL